MTPLLVPKPSRLSVQKGFLQLDNETMIAIPAADKESLFRIAEKLQQAVHQWTTGKSSIVLQHSLQESTVQFQRLPLEHAQAYHLSIAENGILISYSEPEGALYAVSTLKQLLQQYGSQLPCLHIEDEPQYPVRGLLFDVSRNKVPTLVTLYRVVDWMSDLKLNQLQLYMEGFVFAYPSFPQVWETGTPLTGEDLLKLDRYCRERYIDLVPNQTSFGHMDAWLMEEFVHLAETPGGFWYNDQLFLTAGTLDPSNPDSLGHIQKMQDDLLPYFSSSYYNVNCDETYELGKGNNKQKLEEVGYGRLYLEFVHKIADSVKAHGKQMMFWSDMIVQHPDLIPEIPADSILLEWGYEADHPFAERCKLFKEHNLDHYVCPGTCTWNTLTGKVENMLENMRQAAKSGLTYGAKGYLTTHWGDIAHFHQLTSLCAGLVYGAALSWNLEGSEDMDLAAALDLVVYQDSVGRAGQVTLALGNYYLLEPYRIHDATLLGRMFYKPLDDMSIVKNLQPEHLLAIDTYIDDQLSLFKSAQIKAKDASWLEDEITAGAKLVKLACQLALLKCRLRDQADLEARVAQEDQAAIQQNLREFVRQVDSYLSEYRILWLRRNRWSNGYKKNLQGSGLEESMSYLTEIREQCRNMMVDK